MSEDPELFFAPRTDTPHKYRRCRNITLAIFSVIFLAFAIVVLCSSSHRDIVIFGIVLLAIGVASFSLFAFYAIRDAQQSKWYIKRKAARQAYKDEVQLLENTLIAKETSDLSGDLHLHQHLQQVAAIKQREEEEKELAA